MTIKEIVLETQRELPAQKQKEVLDFVDFPKERNGSKKPLYTLPTFTGTKQVEVHFSYKQAQRAATSRTPCR